MAEAVHSEVLPAAIAEDMLETDKASGKKGAQREGMVGPRERQKSAVSAVSHACHAYIDNQ